MRSPLRFSAYVTQSLCTYLRGKIKMLRSEWNMKMKLCKVLHLFGIDILLIRMLEKLVTALNKKLSAIKDLFDKFLSRHQENCECDS